MGSVYFKFFYVALNVGSVPYMVCVLEIALRF